MNGVEKEDVGGPVSCVDQSYGWDIGRRALLNVFAVVDPVAPQVFVQWCMVWDG